MNSRKIDMAMVEFAARAHAASVSGRITDKDTAAFRAAYILTFDEELSGRVADSLLAEYTEAHTVPTLPRYTLYRFMSMVSACCGR